MANCAASVVPLPSGASHLPVNVPPTPPAVGVATASFGSNAFGEWVSSAADEDLKSVRAGDQPMHARRAVNLDELKKLEETGKTVDLTPAGHHGSLWSQPLVITLVSVVGLSILVNLILLVILMVRN